MATSITRANFTTDSAIDQLWHADTGSNTQTLYLYVSSACFDAYFTATKNWGSWSRTLRLRAYYYNGSSWVGPVYTNEQNPGQFDSGTFEGHFRHNWTGYSQSGDVHDYHLWKITMDMPELYDKYFYIQCGSYYYGMEDWTDKKIYGTGYVNGKPYYFAGNTQNDGTAESYFDTRGLRGTRIYTTNIKSIFYTLDSRKNQ